MVQQPVACSQHVYDRNGWRRKSRIAVINRYSRRGSRLQSTRARSSMYKEADTGEFIERCINTRWQPVTVHFRRFVKIFQPDEPRLAPHSVRCPSRTHCSYNRLPELEAGRTELREKY